MPMVWRVVDNSAGRVAQRSITLSHASSNKSKNNGSNGGRKVRQGLRWPRCLEIARKGQKAVTLSPLQHMSQQQQERREQGRRQKTAAKGA